VVSLLKNFAWFENENIQWKIEKQVDVSNVKGLWD
jgi:hypothetical protein